MILMHGDGMVEGFRTHLSHTDPDLAVLVAAETGDDGLVLTLASLDALAAVGHRLEAVVVTAAQGSVWAEVLDRTSAPTVAYVQAGMITGSEWMDGVARALERNNHVSAIAAQIIDVATGAPMPRPRGVSFTGHLLAEGSAPTTLSRTAVMGRSWIARRDALERAGGFDALTMMPQGLVDLAWRLWLSASGVVVDPGFEIRDGLGLDVVAGRDERADVMDWERAVAQERDALAIIYRNLDDRDLDAALDVARSLSRVRLEASIRSGAVDPTHDGLSPDAGVMAFEGIGPRLSAQRRERQRSRVRPDAEVLSVFGDLLACPFDAPQITARHDELLSGLGDDHAFSGRYRVAVVTADALSSRMAGPGIRALRIAKRLSGDHQVRLASMTVAELDDDDVEISVVDASGVADLVEWCDIFVFQGWVLGGNPAFQRADRIFLVDVYDPMHLEQLEQARDDGDDGRLVAVRRTTAVLNEQLLRGDSFFCASGKQRDLWLGHLASLGRVNPAVYDEDPSLETLITAVPFGISDDPPVRTRPALKGVVDGIGPDDKVILWGGGVYNWFDPLTLLYAVDRLSRRRDDVRLVFLGMKHPNPDIPEMRMAVETRRLADELGLTGRYVFFNEEWVAYEDRQNYLLDADVAVTTHLHHVETEYSFRTRVLDYFWAGLPTVATCGDSLADLIEQRTLGSTVPPGDVEALEAALSRLISDDEFNALCRRNVAEVAGDFTWSKVLEPIAERCRSPRRSPDLVDGSVHTGPYLQSEQILVQSGVMRDVKLAIGYVREGGIPMLLTKMRDRAGRALGAVSPDPGSGPAHAS